MKKVALLISGLPRYVEKSFPNIQRMIIEPNNPDVFIHTWNDLDGSLNYPIRKLYQPKILKAENQKNWINRHMNLDRMMASHARSYHRDKFVEMLYSSWYSTQQANLLKEQYRLQHNIRYTHVIRCRFDLHFSTPIDCIHFNPNVLHVSNKWLPEEEMVDDRFGFASNEIMNLYCSGFNLLDYVQSLRDKKDGIFCGETLVYEICRIFGIHYEKIAALTCDNVSHLVAKGEL